MQMAASKRFHKFWFLVLENPGFGWDFLVICLARNAYISELEFKVINTPCEDKNTVLTFHGRRTNEKMVHFR